MHNGSYCRNFTFKNGWVSVSNIHWSNALELKTLFHNCNNSKCYFQLNATHHPCICLQIITKLKLQRKSIYWHIFQNFLFFQSKPRLNVLLVLQHNIIKIKLGWVYGIILLKLELSNIYLLTCVWQCFQFSSHYKKWMKKNRISGIVKGGEEFEVVISGREWEGRENRYVKRNWGWENHG